MEIVLNRTKKVNFFYCFFGRLAGDHAPRGDQKQDHDEVHYPGRPRRPGGSGIV